MRASRKPKMLQRADDDDQYCVSKRAPFGARLPTRRTTRRTRTAVQANAHVQVEFAIAASKPGYKAQVEVRTRAPFLVTMVILKINSPGWVQDRVHCCCHNCEGSRAGAAQAASRVVARSVTAWLGGAGSTASKPPCRCAAMRQRPEGSW